MGLPVAFSMLAAAFCAFFMLILPARAATPKTVYGPDLPALLQVVAEQLPAEWHPQRMENGDVQLDNPVHRFKALINQEGIEIRSENGFTFGLELVRFGFGRALNMPRSGAARINGVRVELSHDPDLVEWFINTPAGVEQGFRLTQAPQEQKGDSISQPGGDFELNFTLRGGLIRRAA